MMACTVITYNMHGFNQGIPLLEELINSISIQPDIIMVQEHWLKSNNLHKFNRFRDFFFSGTPAVTSETHDGMRTGRPYGGILTMVKNKYINCTRAVYSDSRMEIVRVINNVYINLYLPCVGTRERELIAEQILHTAGLCIEDELPCKIICGGDFNCDICTDDPVAIKLRQFMEAYNLVDCDMRDGSNIGYTYQSA